MWYVLLVAIVNLAIGFFLAVSQGRRQRAARAAPPGVWLVSAGRSGPALASAPAPSGLAAPDALLKPIAVPAAPEETVPEGRDARETLDELDRNVAQHQQQLAAIDDRLRRAAQPVQSELVASCVRDLAAAHGQFLSRQDAIDLVLLPIGAPDELEDAHKRLAALWQQQSVEVGAAALWTSRFRPAGDLADQCQEMVRSIDKLVQIGRELRDTLAEMMAGLAAEEPSATPPSVEIAEQCVAR